MDSRLRGNDRRAIVVQAGLPFIGVHWRLLFSSLSFVSSVNFVVSYKEF